MFFVGEVLPSPYLLLRRGRFIGHLRMYARMDWSFRRMVSFRGRNRQRQLSLLC